MNKLDSLINIFFEVLFVEMMKVMYFLHDDLTVGYYLTLLVLDPVIFLYDFDFHVLEKQNEFINHLFDLKYDFVFLFLQFGLLLFIDRIGPLYFVDEKMNK